MRESGRRKDKVTNRDLQQGPIDADHDRGVTDRRTLGWTNGVIE